MTLVGREEPRLFTPPLRELTPETSYGFSVVEFAEEVLGVELFPWQRWFFVHALECREDGSFRFRRVVLLVGRQNGKTTVARILALWCLFVLGVGLVLGTAQNLDTSEDTWEGAVEMVEDNPELAPELERVVRACQPFEEVLHTQAGCTVSNHCGPGCMGILYYHK